MKRNLFTIMLAMFVALGVSAQNGMLSNKTQDGVKPISIKAATHSNNTTNSATRGPLTDDFEGAFPGLWSLTAGSGDWVKSSTVADHTSGTGFFAEYTAYDINGTDPAYITSPKMAVTGGDATFSFWFNYYLDAGTWGESSELYVDVTIDGGATTAGTVNYIAGQEGAGWTQVIIDLTAYEGVDFTGNSVFVAFKGISDYGSYNIAIDDVSGPELDLPSADGKIASVWMPKYLTTPLSQVGAYTFSGVAENIGSGALTNLTMDFEVLDGTMASEWTGSSAAVTSLASLASETMVSTTDYTAMATGDYTVNFTLNMDETDGNLSNNEDSFGFSVNDSVMARDNGLPDEGTLGIGGPGHVGSLFEVMNDDVMTSVSFYLGSDLVTPAGGATMNVVVHEFNGGVVGDLIYESPTYTGTDVAEWHHVYFETPLATPAGQYIVALKELDGGNVSLARCTENYEPQTSWLTIEGTTDWTSTDDFAASFNGNYLLHPNFGVVVPTITIDSPLDGSSIGSTDVDVMFTVENFMVGDNGTGMDDGYILYTIDADPTEISHYSTDDISLTGLSLGDHTIHMWLVDNAGDILDPMVEATATFTVTPPSTDATLSDLTSDGTTVTAFDAATLSYDIELPFGTSVVPTVAYTLNDMTASAVGTPAASLPGSATVVVTAEDGTTIVTYTINYTLAAASMDATLTDLTSDGTTVTAFDAATLSYDIELPFGTTVVPSFTYLLSDVNASAVGTPAASLPGATTVVVTAQDGITMVTYTINYTLAAGAMDADLTDLTSGGATVPAFDAATLTYNIELPFGTTDVPALTFVLSDVNASAVGTPAASLPGSSTVVVTAEDGTTIVTYTINYTLGLTIADLNKVNVNIFPNPSNGVFTVSVSEEFNLEVIDITGKVVSTQVVNNTNNTVSVAQSGVYFLRFSNENAISVQRVVVR